MSAYMSQTPAPHPWLSSMSKRKRDVPGGYNDSNLDERLDDIGMMNVGSGMGMWPAGGMGSAFSTLQLPGSTATAQDSMGSGMRAIKKSRRADGTSLVSRREMESEFATLTIANGGLAGLNGSVTGHSRAGSAYGAGAGLGFPTATPVPTSFETPRSSKTYPASPYSGPVSTSTPASISQIPTYYQHDSSAASADPTSTNGQFSSSAWTKAEPPATTAQASPIDMEDAREVHMKTRSWFEPEKDRIVILDINASDTESESSSGQQRSSSSSSSPRSRHDSPRFANFTNPDSGTDNWEISQAYLSRLPSSMQRGNSLGLDFALPPQDPGLGAMVLFRNPGPAGEENEDEEDGEALFAHIEQVDDEDTDVDMAMASGSGTPMEVDMEFD